MHTRLASRLAAAAALLLLRQSFAEENPKAADTYSWEKAARHAGLSDESIASLATNKVLITDRQFKQVFEPYVAAPFPVFITSDSLLNAFHVLYAESLVRMENANSRRLSRILAVIWSNLGAPEEHLRNADSKLVPVARKRARIVIGTAMRLFGDESIKADKETTGLIDAEVKRVLGASDVLKPEWLGPPDDGFLALDYN